MPAAINRPMRPNEWALLLVLSLLWGGSFCLVGIALRGLPPLTVVALRTALAALLLGLVLLVSGRRPPGEPRLWAELLGMGLLNNVVPFCLIVWGQTRIASGLAAILNAATPLATVLVAHLATSDEKLTGNRLAGVLLGLAGVAVMIGPGAVDGLGRELPAELAVLAAALSYACAGVYGRRFARRGVPPLMTATGQVATSAALLVPLALLVDRPWTLPPPGLPVWGAVLGLAALSTALAYLLYFRLLATAGATNLLLVTFLIPISAITLGTLVLGEHLLPRQLLGMVLIGSGLAAIDGRPLRCSKVVLALLGSGATRDDQGATAMQERQSGDGRRPWP
ncbi:MAG: DMT family transporter [Geminicoccaceae bacterium]